LEADLNQAMAASVALSIPRRTIVGLALSVMLRSPSSKMALARTVAVVVPSPATSLVFVATSLMSLAPMCSNGSSSSISLLTVTPSLVTSGLPKFLSIMTFRPVGPSVTATASARVLTPRCSFSNARSSNNSCFATLAYSYSNVCLAVIWHFWFGNPQAQIDSAFRTSHSEFLRQLRQNIALAQNLDVFPIDFDVRSAVLAEQDLVADDDAHLAPVAGVEQSPRPHGLHFPALRFFLRGVRK